MKLNLSPSPLLRNSPVPNGVASAKPAGDRASGRGTEYSRSDESSRSGSGSLPRIPNDVYETPAIYTEALLSRCPDIVLSGSRILEPCAGSGAIARVLESRGVKVVQRDLLQGDGDIASPQFWAEQSPCDWVVTNPPYGKRVPDKAIPLAFDHASVGIAMLLRITYSEPVALRGEWLEKHADNLALKMDTWPRHRFRPDTNKTDSCTVSWFVWRKDWSWEKLGMTSPFAPWRYERLAEQGFERS